VRIHPEISIVIWDPRVERALTGSAYNERCIHSERRAASFARHTPDVKNLRGMTLAQLGEAPGKSWSLSVTNAANLSQRKINGFYR